MFIKLFNHQELQARPAEQIHCYLFEAALPCLYKLLQAFVYLCEEHRVYDLEAKVTMVAHNLLLTL